MPWRNHMCTYDVKMMTITEWKNYVGLVTFEMQIFMAISENLLVGKICLVTTDMHRSKTIQHQTFIWRTPKDTTLNPLCGKSSNFLVVESQIDRKPALAMRVLAQLFVFMGRLGWLLFFCGGKQLPSTHLIPLHGLASHLWHPCVTFCQIDQAYLVLRPMEQSH